MTAGCWMNAINDGETYRRRSLRLRRYDYSHPGMYFLTVCTQDRNCLFGRIDDGKMVMNAAGRMIEAEWDGLPMRFDHIQLVEFTVMPNHLHGIMMLTRRGEPCVRLL